ELAPYESWALKPKFVDDNPYLLTPGIKYGTKKGDFTHMNELFAPILTVMKAKDLKEAIDIVNSTGYGLTAGFESLDEREWEYFHTHIEAGNIYINKPTTGAIVLRQPFGGIKKSAIGFGRKVGIYNYITQFLDIEQSQADQNVLDNELVSNLNALSLDLNEKDKADFEVIKAMARSYAYHAKHEFASAKDYVNIRGEDNLFSYTKVKNIAYRVHKDDSLKDILGVILAASVLNIDLVLSYDEHEKIDLVQKINQKISSKTLFLKESKENFISKIADYERIRYFAPLDVNDEIFIKAASCAKIIANAKPLINGRFELLLYHNEKALSISFHRYGNLGIRALK
ncbi:aldehyde dehydrogenase family protein, partial [Campylobacter lari]|nr:aldehyde dehydrogenase family protein [Campylobacter lari]